MYRLYGDGIHDDTNAIQEMIDSGACEVCLPVPKKCYLISKPLELPSNFRLVLPRFAEIKLANNSNCLMVRNKLVSDYADRLPSDLENKERHLWYYVNDYSPNEVTENVEICGGIWNCNNMEQLPNPERIMSLEPEKSQPHGYTGEGMIFYNVRNLKLSSLTLKDPVRWGISFDTVSYFTVEDITFDYNLGNPCAINMDGVHLNGNCHFGSIRNLKGACYDDLVAINAHEGSRGPITNIQIDGLFAESCHSAVRLLTVSDEVKNIHISNVYGTYYQYCIGFTKYYPGETTGVFDGVHINNIYASKASREGIYPIKTNFVFPFIWIQGDTHVKNLKITDVFREEYLIPVDTIYIGETAIVDYLMIDHVVIENHTESEIPVITNKGLVKQLSATNLRIDGKEFIYENTTN